MSVGQTLDYFAFGSNLYLPRMQARVPSAVPVTVARLPDHRLTFDKLGRDDSNKCSFTAAEGETLWGVVYRIAAQDLPALDEAEGPGYDRVEVRVAAPKEWLAVFTYRARPDWIGRGWPYDWYRELVVTGARHHALPAEHVARIAGVTAVPDPDARRSRANRPRPW